MSLRAIREETSFGVFINVVIQLVFVLVHLLILPFCYNPVCYIYPFSDDNLGFCTALCLLLALLCSLLARMPNDLTNLLLEQSRRAMLILLVN